MDLVLFVYEKNPIRFSDKRDFFGDLHNVLYKNILIIKERS